MYRSVPFAAVRRSFVLAVALLAAGILLSARSASASETRSLGPSRLGMSRWVRQTDPPALSYCGFDQPRTPVWEEWSGSVVTTGYDHWFDHSVLPFPCPQGRTMFMQGLVQFDLSTIRAGIVGLNRAELSFTMQPISAGERDGACRHGPSSGPARLEIGAVAARWHASTAPANGQVAFDAALPRVSVDPAPLTQTVDVTGIVQAWLDGGANNGFVLDAAHNLQFPDGSERGVLDGLVDGDGVAHATCRFRYGEFSLRLEVDARKPILPADPNANIIIPPGLPVAGAVNRPPDIIIPPGLSVAGGLHPCTGVTLTADPEPPKKVGAMVTLTAQATGCSQPQYEFSVVEVDWGRTRTVLRGYSGLPSVTVDTSTLHRGVVAFIVSVRERGSTASLEAMQTLNFRLD